MKAKISVLVSALLALVWLSGCTEKTENDFDRFMAGLYTGSYLKGKANFDPGTNTWTDQSVLGNTLDAGNLANARVGVRVRTWGDDPVVTANIYVVKNTNANQTAWRFIKKYTIADGDTSYFDMYVSAQEIATALGLGLNVNAGNFAPGSIFTCYVEAVSKAGKKYTINNSNFTGSGANFYYSVFSFRASVVCPFNPAAMPGNYVVVTDQWEDWSPGDVIPSPITATTATSMSTFGIYPNMAYPGANSPQTWTINVNASTGVATVTNQYYGKYSTSPSATQYAVSTVGTGNFIFSCTNPVVMTMLLNHHVFGAPTVSAGQYVLTLRKQ